MAAGGCHVEPRHARSGSGAAPHLLFALGIAAAVVGFVLVWLAAR
jgi:hypothetical protein